MRLKFLDALEVHIPEDWVIVLMREDDFKRAFFHKDHSIIRSGNAYYWLNDDYRLVFCCKRNGSKDG